MRRVDPLRSIVEHTLGRRIQTASMLDGMLFWTSWYALSLVAMILSPSYLLYGKHFWNLQGSEALLGFAIGMAFLIVLLFVRIIASRYERPLLLGVAGASLACFISSWFLLASVWGLPTSKRNLVAGAFLGVSLALLPMVFRRIRWLALAGLAASLPAIAALDLPQTDSGTPSVDTNSYKLRLRLHSGLLPIPIRVNSAGGGIETYRDGFVAVTATGEFYRLSWEDQGDALKSERLPLDAPFNRRDFDESEVPSPSHFRITDLLVDENGGAPTIYVAHEHWHPAERCITLRVSMISVDAAGGAFTPADHWKTIFESQPCVIQPSMRSGGRLAMHSRGLLLTLGEYELPYAQRMDVSYGKILLLDRKGNASVFSLGHRNPQGLLVDSEERIWSTEHGPQGGDEVNLITEGGNYGWPLVTYGNEYGFDSWSDPWALAGVADKHTAAELLDPVYAFVPSIGIAQLIELGDNQMFPEWSGDLMIASMAAQTLYHAKNHDGRLLYYEPIAVGQEIKDLAQTPDGRIALWTDQGEVMSLTRAPWKSDGASVYHGRCRPCHEPMGGTTVSGPLLDGLLGTPVAARSDYAYSQALLNLGGTWTEEQLDGFLKDPGAYAPGTAMDAPGISEDAVRRALIEYLKEK